MKTFAAQFVLLLVCCLAFSAQSGRVSQRATPVPAATPNDLDATPSPASEKIEVGDDGIVKVETRLVNVPVTVVSRGGNYIADLTRDEFEIFEDGAPQKIAAFGTSDAPLSVVIMLDMSRSGRFRPNDVKDAALAFMSHLRADDWVQIVAFDQKFHRLTAVTQDYAAAREAVRSVKTGGRTALYDSLDRVMQVEVPRLPTPRKAIVLLTDGIDNTSKRATYDSTLEYAEELDAAVYVVEFESAPDDVDTCLPPGQERGRTRAPREGVVLGGGILGGILGGVINGGTTRPAPRRLPTNLAGHNYLAALAESTGGQLFFTDQTERLSRAFKDIADALHSQYSLAYYPTDKGATGQRKKIRVRVTRPNMAARNRSIYVVGAAPVAPTTPAAAQKQ